MGKTAVIFPGQGAQYVGMAKDFYDNFEDSKKVFDEADDVLDIELKKICSRRTMTSTRQSTHSRPWLLQRLPYMST